MKQVVVIGGGEAFDSYEDYLKFLHQMDYNPEPREGKGWKANLQEDLGSAYKVIFPKMPNPINAHYAEWCIYMDRVREYINDDAVFVGHSLGGIFLLRYLDYHNMLPKALLLVGSPQEKCGDFVFDGPISFDSHFGQVHIFHSKDDEVVPAREAFILNSKFIHAKMHLFEDRGHFNEEHFPELVTTIKRLKRTEG